jgi:transposase
MNKIKVLAIDLAKSVFQLHAVDARGVVVLRKQVKRKQLLQVLAQLRPCTVAMEACAGAHHWARQFQAFGHTVRLIPPQHVKPFVKGNKTDRNDAEAICEAAQRPNMRFVPVKSLEQQAWLAAQQLRSLVVKFRTAFLNHIRGELAEFGIVVPKGVAKLTGALHDSQLLDQLPTLMQQLAAQMRQQLCQLDESLSQASRRIEVLAQAHPSCRHLMRRPGIGVHTASALVAQIDPTHFKNGRHLSAFLGLVPKEHSSGNKQIRLGITKRGNKELRSLLIHGARSALRAARGKDDPLSRWLAELTARRGKHKAIVALANKMARYAWVDLMQARQLGDAL